MGVGVSQLDDWVAPHVSPGAHLRWVVRQMASDDARRRDYNSSGSRIHAEKIRGDPRTHPRRSAMSRSQPCGTEIMAG